jgi:hypothetical protein
VLCADITTYDEDDETPEEASNPKVPAIVTCALHSGSGLVAVAIEGLDEVTLVHCVPKAGGDGVDLRVTGTHSVGGVMLPTRLAFGADGILWAVGGPCSDTATSVHMGMCSFKGTQAAKE